MSAAEPFCSGGAWGRFGFVDASCESQGWYARTLLPIEGPSVTVIANFEFAEARYRKLASATERKCNRYASGVTLTATSMAMKSSGAPT